MVSVGRLYYHCGHHGECRETVLLLRHTMVGVGSLYYHSDIPWCV